MPNDLGMKKVLVRFFLFLLLALIGFAVIYHDLVAYGISQFRGQWKIVHEARPLEEVLNDPMFPDSLKEKIRLIENIARYAQDSLGLKKSENYTTLYDQHNKPLLWVLTASEKYKLKSYEWSFPVVGTVSYKGFFDFEKGALEDSLLKLKGLDTDYGEVSAWSTLGWFKDPILSNMLRRTEGQLAELIIHEMTHATVYVKSNVDFNENLASMIGEVGAERYLRSKYGSESAQLQDYIFRKEDYDRFSAHMLSATQVLESLYNSFSNLTDSDMSARKALMIKAIVQNLDTVNFHYPYRYKELFQRRMPNNAYFLNYVRYDSQKNLMKYELEHIFNNNILRYLSSIKDR